MVSTLQKLMERCKWLLYSIDCESFMEEVQINDYRSLGKYNSRPCASEEPSMKYSIQEELWLMVRTSQTENGILKSNKKLTCSKVFIYETPNGHFSCQLHITLWTTWHLVPLLYRSSFEILLYFVPSTFNASLSDRI